MIATAPEHLFFIRREKLSDGSMVFNVWFGEVEFPCVTEADAEALAEKLVDAINDHSNGYADTIDER